MRWLLTHARIPYLALVTLLTLAFAWPLSGLKIDRSNSAMVANNPQQEALHTRFKQLFGQDEYLLLSLTSDTLLDPAGLEEVANLTRRVQKIPGVRSVMSLSNAQQLHGGDFGVEPVPLLSFPLDIPNDREQLERDLDADPRLAELLISTDRRTAALTIEVDNLPADDPRLELVVRQLRNLIASHAPHSELHLTGTLVQKQDVATYVLRDQKVLMPLSVLVLALCLGLAFRQIAGVILPLLVTGISLIWTLGSYALAGLSLNTITSLLPPVVMVLSVTTSIHLYIGWQRHRGDDEGLDPLRLLLSRVRELRRPCFYTALTTALGLLSLTLSTIPAIRDFGIFAALGVIISFGIGITLVPVGLSYLDVKNTNNPARSSKMRTFLQLAARLSTHRAGSVCLLALLLSLASLPGFADIHNNTDLVRFLRSDAPLYRDTLYIDRTLNGVNPLDFVLSRKDGKPLTAAADLERIDRFAQQLRDQGEIGSVISLVDLVKRLHQVDAGLDQPTLPKDPDQLNYAIDLLKSDTQSRLLRQLASSDLTTLRINARVRALGTAAVVNLVKEQLTQAEQIFGADYLLQPTGGYYRIAQESNQLVRTLMKSFGLSLLLVMLAIAIMFRSPSLTLVALVPNLIPLFWTGGLMGYAGIDLSTGTAMIGAVVFGLIVDATIHYLARYQHFTREELVRAIEHTTLSIGRALTIASLVLVFGFWVGCFGSFKPTIYFSLLVGTTMLGALLCDLLVLPACLVLHARWRWRAT